MWRGVIEQPATLTIDARVLERVLDDAASKHINALAPDLPPLWWNQRWLISLPHWPILSGRVDHDDPQTVAEQWVARLGLSEVPEPLSGTRSWTGKALKSFGREYSVDIWYVANREAFEAR